MSEAVIVWGEDWQGVYIDGTLVRQGHSVSARDLLEAQGVTVTDFEMSPGYAESGESLPDDLAHVERA